ncbi:MAG: selenocysteine-specific translation elongation factor [Pseudomonadota bacterium]|jgi:selenocysteine-specific elongation factor
MIVGTAGHIDHGKTSLVKALTGVDTDRLKEEKERGITVDLGFAYLPPSEDGPSIGFVDMPGHERLVHNMLAGATGIDHVLLVIAADDGPMPQTREHLAILDLLGLDQGAVVLSKSDMVDEHRLAAVRNDIKALLRGTHLARAPIFPVSSVTRTGLLELHEHLRTAGRLTMTRPSRAGAGFRLSIDRSFSLPGAGTVVTGGCFSGAVSVGDQLMLSPSGREVRVRGVHAQNSKTEIGVAGQRLAINLTGADRSEVRRGDWLVAAPLFMPTQRLDCRLRLLGSEPAALAQWTAVHLHIGAQDVMARVVVLEGGSIPPGSEAWVQLELDRPVTALQGDRFVLRDASGQRTVGGGTVVDGLALPSRRKKAERVALLQALQQTDALLALRAVLDLCQPGGVDLNRFFSQRNLPQQAIADILATVNPKILTVDGVRIGFLASQLKDCTDAVLALLQRFHAKSPDSPGLTREQLHRQIKARPTAPAFDAWINTLVHDGPLKRSGPHHSLVGHVVELQGVEKQIWERLKPWLDEGGIHPPKLSDLMLRDRSLRKDQVDRTLQRLARMGRGHLVGAEYFIQSGHFLALAVQAHQLAAADPHLRLNVKELREAAGVSRHLSMPLVEYFDQIGLTQRDEVGRHFRRDPRKMLAG